MISYNCDMKFVVWGNLRKIFIIYYLDLVLLSCLVLYMIKKKYLDELQIIYKLAYTLLQVLTKSHKNFRA